MIPGDTEKISTNVVNIFLDPWYKWQNFSGNFLVLNIIYGVFSVWEKWEKGNFENTSRCAERMQGRDSLSRAMTVVEFKKYKFWRNRKTKYEQ